MALSVLSFSLHNFRKGQQPATTIKNLVCMLLLM
jgi:hypothetical protein